MKAAIYSRKSILSDKGESIENQIQLCKEYASKIGINEFIIYEDEGFSGKNINRPMFKKMMADAKTKRFNAIICYRLDRISRNVSDFSTLIDDLKKMDIAFISIKEQFDTTTPMGTAMMYIASVFAQLERETIAERVRDNMIELAKTGRWLGGKPLLGFDTEKVKEDGKEVTYLVHNDEQLELVKLIYDKYLEVKSIYKTLKYLYQNNIGYQYRKWSLDRISLILKGCYYVQTNEDVKRYCESKGITVIGDMNGNGMVPYNQKIGTNRYKPTNEWIYAVGKHPGIIPADIWLKVQYMIAEKAPLSFRSPHSRKSFLTGLLKCGKCGMMLCLKYGPKNEDGSRLIYYACKSNGTFLSCKNKYIDKDVMDNKIIEYLEKLNADEDFLRKELKLDIVNSDKGEKEIAKLRKLISRNSSSIQNLVQQIAVISVDASVYLRAEIEKLTKENYDLKEALGRLENSKEQENLKELNKEMLISTIKNFKASFEHCKTIEEKRDLFASIIKEIIWSGNVKDIKIELQK